MFYKTSRCPNCKRFIQVLNSQYGGYGSPFRVCPYCGKEYYDADWVELAAQTPGYLLKQAIIYSIRWGVVGGCLLFICLIYLASQFVNRISTSALGGYVLFVTLATSILAYHTYLKYKKDVVASPEMINSMMRLMDPCYKAKYESMAGEIPKNSYYYIFEKE